MTSRLACPCCRVIDHWQLRQLQQQRSTWQWHQLSVSYATVCMDLNRHDHAPQYICPCTSYAPVPYSSSSICPAIPTAAFTSSMCLYCHQQLFEVGAACLTLHACAQVDPKRQKLLGLKTKDGKMATDEAAIADLAIKPNTKVHNLQPAQRTGSVCECRSCQITTVPVIQHAVHQESSSASSNAAAQATGSPPTSFKPPHACLMWTTAAGDDDGSA